jgi:hypothetical protein
MAIAYQTSATDSYNTGIAGTTHTLTVTKPTGLSNGDFLIITINSRESDNTARRLASPPEFIGFTQLTEQSTYDTSAISKAWVYIRQVGVASEEPTSYSFTLTYQTAAGTPIIVSVIARFSGVSSYRPLDVYGLYGSTGSGVTVVCPSVTNIAPYTYLVPVCYTRGANAAGDIPSISSGTLVAHKTAVNTVSSCTAMAYLPRGSSTGATGTFSFSWVAGGVNNGIIVALGSTEFQSVTPQLGWFRA